MSTQTMTSVADAISTLRNPFPPVSLIKHYKGTTLNQQGRILAADLDSLTIQATKRRTFPILNGMIHLRSKIFSRVISANIQPLDYSKGTFQVSNLCYSDWQERRAERVQPKNPTYISMTCGQKAYRVFLVDISTVGAGILVNKTIDLESELQAGEDVLIEVRISPGHMITNLKCRIVYHQIVWQGMIKFGLSLFPDATQKIALENYVLERQDEILDELKKDYQRMREPCRVENLYF